jgi:hypothetical protein
VPTDAVVEAVSARNSMINLFGRVLARIALSKVDRAVQVAHAFTIHIAEPEVDFFTAVDDLSQAGDTGSAGMNNVEISAGVFYRRASQDFQVPADVPTSQTDRSAAQPSETHANARETSRGGVAALAANCGLGGWCKSMFADHLPKSRGRRRGRW